MVWVTKIQLDG